MSSKLNANKLHRIRERKQAPITQGVVYKRTTPIPQSRDGFGTYIPAPIDEEMPTADKYAYLLNYHKQLTQFLSDRQERFNHGEPMELRYHMGPARVHECGIPQELRRLEVQLTVYKVATGTVRP